MARECEIVCGRQIANALEHQKQITGEAIMLIRWAKESDLPAWYALATEVSDIFQHPVDMGAELRAKASGQGAVGRHEMLAAVDKKSGDAMGFICFSRAKNDIAWLAVSEKYRGKGVGSRLLEAALQQLDGRRDITVVTFCADYLPGAAARALYKKHGFTQEKPTTYNGLPRCTMIRPATGGTQ